MICSQLVVALDAFFGEFHFDLLAVTEEWNRVAAVAFTVIGAYGAAICVLRRNRLVLNEKSPHCDEGLVKKCCK